MRKRFTRRISRLSRRSWRSRRKASKFRRTYRISRGGIRL